jgi:hypothetical protein
MKQLRRKRKLQLLCRRGMTIGMTFVLILFLSVIGSHMTAKATAREHTDAVKYFANIEVQPGDTLWSIAKEHMTEEYSSIPAYVKDIASVNDMLPCTMIKSGEYIILPYYE